MAGTKHQFAWNRPETRRHNMSAVQVGVKASCEARRQSAQRRVRSDPCVGDQRRQPPRPMQRTCGRVVLACPDLADDPTLRIFRRSSMAWSVRSTCSGRHRLAVGRQKAAIITEHRSAHRAPQRRIADAIGGDTCQPCRYSPKTPPDDRILDGIAELQRPQPPRAHRIIQEDPEAQIRYLAGRDLRRVMVQPVGVVEDPQLFRSGRSSSRPRIIGATGRTPPDHRRLAWPNIRGPSDKPQRGWHDHSR